MAALYQEESFPAGLARYGEYLGRNQAGYLLARRPDAQFKCGSMYFACVRGKGGIEYNPAMHKVGFAKAIQRTFHLFQGNYNQLKKALIFYEESPESSHLWHGNMGPEIFYILEEIVRLLHNFATSSLTLVDHTRNQVNGLDGIPELSSFMKEYKEEIEKRFEQSENHQLIQGLRNYMLHFSITEAFSRWSWERDKGEERIIMIKTPPLLEWDQWKPLARNKLSQLENGLPVRQFIEEYYNDVEAFNRWIWQKQGELIQSRVLRP